MDEVKVDTIDVGDELRVCVETRFHPAQVVSAAPVIGELLKGGGLNALGLIADHLAIGKACRADAAAEIVVGLPWNVDAERTDRARTTGFNSLGCVGLCQNR